MQVADACSVGVWEARYRIRLESPCRWLQLEWVDNLLDVRLAAVVLSADGELMHWAAAAAAGVARLWLRPSPQLSARLVQQTLDGLLERLDLELATHGQSVQTGWWSVSSFSTTWQARTWMEPWTC